MCVCCDLCLFSVSLLCTHQQASGSQLFPNGWFESPFSKAFTKASSTTSTLPAGIQSLPVALCIVDPGGVGVFEGVETSGRVWGIGLLLSRQIDRQIADRWITG